MGALYFAFMMCGAYMIRVPPPGWRPAHWIAPVKPKPMVTTSDVTAARAIQTPQFWLLWMVLCLNVTAGIGFRCDGSAVFRVHDVRGVHDPRAAAGLASSALDRTGEAKANGHDQRRDRRARDSDSTVLASLDGTVSQRHGGHRRAARRAPHALS